MKKDTFYYRFKQPRILTGVAMLIALHVILKYFNIMIGDTLQIGISFLPIALCGMLYGPLFGGIAAAIGDVLGFITKPSGFYFPMFTLNAFLTGCLFGIFLYRKRITIGRIAGTTFAYMCVISLLLTPIALFLMYGSSLFAIPRIYKAMIEYPINTALLYTVTKCIDRYYIVMRQAPYS